MSERNLAEDRKKFEPMRPSWTVSLQLNLSAYIGEWDENLRLTEEQKERSEKYAILYEGFDLGEARRIFAAYQAGAERGAAPPAEKLPCGCIMYWQRTRAFCKEHIHGLRCEQDYV